MGYDGYITIGTKLDTSGIDANMSRLGKSLETKTAQMSNTMSKTFSLLRNTIVGLGIGAVVYGITRELDSAISRVDTLNNFANVMGNLGINAEDANKSIEYLSDKLTGLPTKLDDAALSVQRFTSANGNLQASTEMFLALNNAVLAGGGSMQLQTSAIEQMAQAYSKGKPDMMEWRTMMMAMPAQMNQVAQAMGFGAHGADALGEALRNGQISMNDFMATMVRMNQEGVGGFKSFEEQARNATGGIQTSIANLKTAISRGLATIIDTIGQSNIAGFINSIAKAINTASLYVAAFVKLIMTAINAIGALFGMKTAKKASNTQKDVKKSAVSMGGLSDSANTASNNIGKAAGNAKKLKKELKQIASFDEMNVLSKNASNAGSSGGSGGSGGGGGGTANLGDLSGIEIPTTEVESKADKINAIFEKMKTNIQKIFGKIDFKPLANSLKELWNATKPLGKTAWEGLSWAWKNILQPLAKWTIEDYLPSWLKNIASALKVLNPILKAFIKAWKIIYEKFFKPVTQPIPEYFIKYLKALKPLLESVAKFLSKREKLLTGMFVALMLLINPMVRVMAFLTLVKIAIENVSKAWRSMKEFAKQAWEGVKEVWSRVKSWFDQNVIQPIKTAFSPLVSFFTGIFKEIWKFIESVFKVIGQLAKGCWETIKIVWGIVASWFQQKVIDPIKKKFEPFWTGLKTGASKAWQGIKEVFSKVGNFFENTFSTAWKKVKNVFSTGGKVFTGIKEGIVSTFKTIVNGLIGGINTVIRKPFQAINDSLAKIRSISIAGKKPFGDLGTIHVPQIPKLAVGGIVNLPGRGVPIGGAIAGEAGREAVLPLQNFQVLQEIADAIGSRITINANITNTMNGRIISRELQRVQNDSDFAYNR